MAAPVLERLALRNDRLLAEVVPHIGGGLARLDWLDGDQAQPLLRGLPPDVNEPPLPGQLACFPLLPWSNRMAPSGFAFEDRRHVPAPNRPGDPCPIHGDGWCVQRIHLNSWSFPLNHHALRPSFVWSAQ